MNIRTFALTTVFLGTLASSWAQPAPGPLEIDGRKVLTLVSNDPPGLRCNNNIQVAAELANTYKVPILIYPVSFMPAGTKAPIAAPPAATNRPLGCPSPSHPAPPCHRPQPTNMPA